ncbi:AraC family transcriptional regulator [Burkholderia sp. Bp9142]|uniref:AraC family transcriptional regulator n=1 Tax=Burkholderia sp. Bp9142 TaxID=2184573 RepID=UPI000F59C791|nr:AraC family transcriptional regulator [Burkholderia sp. Bp9142]RQR29672.1 AraC family transcriptional regulator [Burkholderia sp. Bp9142]
MDILSDILHVAGLQCRLLDMHALSPGDALRFPCERSFGLHTVTRGQAFVHAPNLDEPLALLAGDMVLMARGSVHLLSLDRQPPACTSAIPVADFPGAERRAVPVHGSTLVISAAYQLWHEPLHPFLRSLSPWFVIRGNTLQQLSALPLTIGLLDRELGDRALGATSATHGLLDALFVFALREIAEREHPSGAPGWHHAIADRSIREALTFMHGNLSHGWTLEELARQTGLSRSALAERFRNALGDTPLSHLRTLRMQKAMQLLSDTQQSLEQVAQAVGYQDAFGFSKVFKRSTGQSPSQFRKQDALEKLTSDRFQQV